jgi:hypothetical protein
MFNVGRSMFDVHLLKQARMVYLKDSFSSNKGWRTIG